MTKTIFVISILMSVMLFCAGASGNFAFAKTSNEKGIMTPEEKKKFVKNAQALAEELRKKALEKIHNDSKAKKSDSKKQIALDAAKSKALEEAKKKQVVYKISKIKK
ncbi:MAG: hypothetical protein ACT4OD_01150 [Candidatus Nitrosotenuis sp.]